MATDEIRFGDNDRLAALVAHVTRASALILLSDVDGLYDGDPRKGGARRIDVVAGPEDLAHVRAGKTGQSGVGTGGMSTKVDSALIATAAGIATVVTSAAHAAAALAGERTGTYFAPTGHRPSTRLLWLAHAAVARGALKLDDGAVEAVIIRRASLLPAGITGVDGAFDAGDPVDLTTETGTRGRPGPRQLRRQGDPRPHGPLHPLALHQARPRIRTRSSPPRRPGHPLASSTAQPALHAG